MYDFHVLGNFLPNFFSRTSIHTWCPVPWNTWKEPPFQLSWKRSQVGPLYLPPFSFSTIQVEVEVVLADGTLVKANAQEHEDLFWAVRGGGEALKNPDGSKECFFGP